jgi:hypothetical protein
VHRSRVSDEIEAGPGIPGEEFGRQQVAFQSVAPRARQHDVARHVRAPVGQWMHVVESGEFEVERGGTVHAASAAVTHGGAFDGSLLMSGWNDFAAASRAREAGE